MSGQIVDACNACRDHSKGIRVVLDGVEVTNRCVAITAYDDGTVSVVLLKHRDGKPYTDPEHPTQAAWENLTGPGSILRPSQN